MPAFKDMTPEEKADLTKKIGACLKDCGLETTKVSQTSETVCNLRAATVEQNTSLAVSQELPSSGQEQADKFNAAIKPIVDGIEGVTITVTAKLGAGDKYKTIGGLMPIKGEEAVELTHQEGEVWLVDFWATWCPPCQAPMAHNQAMLEKRGAEWAGKVRIIGISIDQSKEAVATHCESKKWMSPEHYHRHTSDCSKAYSVSGVPHVMLIDQQGFIAFKGHPAHRPDLEADLDTLARGEKLTGKGTGPAPEEGRADAAPEGFKEMDAVAVQAEITQLKTVFEGFTQEEEMKELAKAFPRAFCVLVHQQEYSPATEQTLQKYENYRVLVGKSDALEKVKAKLEEKVKGTFELVLREQAV